MYHYTFCNDNIDAFFKVWVFFSNCTGLFYHQQITGIISSLSNTVTNYTELSAGVSNHPSHFRYLHGCHSLCLSFICQSLRGPKVSVLLSNYKTFLHTAAVNQSSLCTKCILWKATRVWVFWETGVTLTVRMQLSFNNERRFCLHKFIIQQCNLKII